MNKKQALLYAVETARDNQEKLQDIRNELDELKDKPAGSSFEIEFVNNTNEAIERLAKLTDDLIEIGENQKEITESVLNKMDELETRLNEIGKQIAGKKKKGGKKKKEISAPEGEVPLCANDPGCGNPQNECTCTPDEKLIFPLPESEPESAEETSD